MVKEKAQVKSVVLDKVLSWLLARDAPSVSPAGTGPATLRVASPRFAARLPNAP